MCVTECTFCRIVAGDMPARVVYRSDRVVAFHDIRPQAPVHILVVPVQHVASLAELKDRELAGELLLVAAEVARSQGLEPGGFRLVANTGRQAGQTVYHLHLHVLGGRRFGWPPG